MQGSLIPGFPESFPLDEIVRQLRAVRGVVAIVLGGSWAAGRARADSDVDLGIYYRPSTPLDIPAVRQVAAAFNDTQNPVVTEPGQWGRWVNGGAWLTVGGRRADFLYRDLDLVSRTIDECIAGQSRADFWQQPPYGFHSQIYCAETRACVPLHDPEAVIPPLKAKVAVYPTGLKRRQINSFVWGSEFTLRAGTKSVKSGEAYIVTGFLVRCVMEMVQALYALNETFFMNDKYVYREIAEFTIVPASFLARVDQIVSGGISPEQLAARYDAAVVLQRELRALAGDQYTPRF
ncbi:MAG: nucleotidyltransferase domain-containing protein [Chloroflexi bacterium]|nr:nucleotidyltransferase domain-containing protein [Chloroflexota bacterium]